MSAATAPALVVWSGEAIDLSFAGVTTWQIQLFMENLNQMRGSVPADRIHMPAGAATAALIRGSAAWGLNCVPHGDGGLYFRGLPVEEDTHPFRGTPDLRADIVFTLEGQTTGRIEGVRVS